MIYRFDKNKMNNKKIIQAPKKASVASSSRTAKISVNASRPKPVLIKESWDPRGDKARYKND